MVVLNRIYTRTGDQGDTSLGDGTRASKDALRVETYGNVDEANSCIGLARLYAQGAVDEMLARIQSDMFDLGADLCTPDRGVDLGYEPLRIIQSQTDRLEAEIDRMNADLQPLRSFILPAGSPAAAHLHLARTVTRRAERSMVSLARVEPVSVEALKYINRLSDFLFVAARFVNLESNGGKGGDVLWVPGSTRN